MDQLEELKARLKSVEDERDQFKAKVQTLDAAVAETTSRLASKDRELEELRLKTTDKAGSNGILSDGEYGALKQAVEDLIVQNEEKSMQIEELRKAVLAYQKVEEIILNSKSVKRAGSTDGSTIHREQLSPDTGPPSTLTSAEDIRSRVAVADSTPKRTVSVQRSNSYDASKFNRVVVSNEDSNNRDRKISSTSLPKDYGYKVNAAPDTAEVPKEPKKKRGFRRFFSRIKRSTSQEVLPTASPFRRGGARATAGARLGGGRPSYNKYQPLQSDTFLNPFVEWTNQQVLIWLQDIGLGAYVNECRSWCKSAEHILNASPSEVDKHLKINNPLHRKKLKLALEGMRSGSRKDHLILDGLNTESIMKWLDDIGLPQYKHQFYEARIDGRMLNHLAVDDLLYMKINNALHHMSIKRGIEVLRTHQFNMSTLKRRPSPERNTTNCSTLNGSVTVHKDRDVSLWTNHRVMEWLRMIDLSEYAANLRGSGVHGALIMLEPRFTVEHLADILIIPTSKSLIRRHLSGHFVNLVGQQVQSKKREVECIAGMALTLNMKVKPKKTNLFKRGRPASEYLCPLESKGSAPLPSKAESEKVKTAVALYKKELIKQEAKRDSKLKRQISS